ncbi:MAG: hypothetical protein A2900_00385 [Candidatus Chisholmbacteria bacterium RIFCSPLOWO2_01_FULL_50_28]|uniref:Uncharacterized protein n=1 Tax=Candidatus Chisholmbacteria bacterium RIFCSPHIGHO2_01_FULL_52_32 TaxID=1797591 RepID=A0A1G1VR86_9BACT|nr:MAG: hypothetical protein A2786_00730 [Candidatus Chisholmbacteria bacterium RIFCSPHIGHO2_01_FULL_52_32]OGY19562.1 MAG: hypothetical protein A2900_00385 [Candidatus Chisholmbacteria bacterium RIFCSPLOWO2_01_FULL_50_28]
MILTSDKQLEEIKQLIEISGLTDAEKGRWKARLSQMLPSELLELKLNLLRQLMIDAQFETADEIVTTKKVPEEGGGLVTTVLSKLLAKVDEVEERTKRAAGE